MVQGFIERPLLSHICLLLITTFPFFDDYRECGQIKDVLGI